MLRLDALTLKQLRALTAVAEHGSITAAAQALSLTAPAVHTQLKSLETALDAPVLSRGGSGHGGAQLTAEGQAVLRAGEVDMAVNYGLTAAEVERGYVLTCQSRPVTAELTVDYDA